MMVAIYYVIGHVLGLAIGFFVGRRVGMGTVLRVWDQRLDKAIADSRARIADRAKSKS
jgi:membrane protein DedA with SNARE-associated domain